MRSAAAGDDAAENTQRQPTELILAFTVAMT
jgi:hypothetical protein